MEATANLPKLGSCTKKTYHNDRANEEQRKFFVWAWDAGERAKANKLSARTAADLMPLHGTHLGAERMKDGDEQTRQYWQPGPSGAATFRRHFCWPPHRIKAFFGDNQQKKNKASEKRARESVAATVGPAGRPSASGAASGVGAKRPVSEISGASAAVATVPKKARRPGKCSKCGQARTQGHVNVCPFATNKKRKRGQGQRSHGRG